MSALAFELPAALEAREPPEARGLRRDEVRLMVSRRGDQTVEHARFENLPDFLRPGDLLVINTSATLPAAVTARHNDGSELKVHFSTRQAPGWWVVEVRGTDRLPDGERLELAGGAELEIVAPYASGARLRLARADVDAGYLARHGEPIRYDYVPERWSLDAYQTAYATAPGSAEMPSAGRPFTPELITRLTAAGVLFAPLTLHTGVSSPERGERPYAEPYEVPPATARLVNAVRIWGGRVIAVGTTVVRVLETTAEPDGRVRSGAGWTNLIVTPERGAVAVDGLITGWHEPEASHFAMLEAVAGAELLERSYAAALEQGYLWHEFGDSQLILR